MGRRRCREVEAGTAGIDRVPWAQLTKSFSRLPVPRWTNSRDRVNNWLLESLQRSETLAQAHRAMLDMPDLCKKDWARLGLKYWTVDEAATVDASETCSTIGAVDSLRGRHTDRITFSSNLLKRKRSTNSSLREIMAGVPLTRKPCQHPKAPLSPSLDLSGQSRDRSKVTRLVQRLKRRKPSCEHAFITVMATRLRISVSK
jgi:hypothetical protein